MIIEIEITTRLTTEEWAARGRVIPWETLWRLDTGCMDGAQIAEAFQCLHEALRQAGWRADEIMRPPENETENETENE